MRSNKYDPYSATGEFSPFKEALDRELGESSTRLRREAARQGRLSSGSIFKQQRELEDRAGTEKASKLAQLFSEYQNRRLSAIPLALQAGTQAYNMDIGRIGAGFQYGGLERQLKDAEAKARLAEWMRAREEKKMPIAAAGTVLGTPTQYGLNELEIPQSSPWRGALESGTQLGLQEMIRRMYSGQGGGNMVPAVQPIGSGIGSHRKPPT